MEDPQIEVRQGTVVSNDPVDVVLDHQSDDRKGSLEQTMQQSLNKTMTQALRVLHYRDVVYFEPYTGKWKHQLAPNCDIHSSPFGRLEFASMRAQDGVIICRPKPIHDHLPSSLPYPHQRRPKKSHAVPLPVAYLNPAQLFEDQDTHDVFLHDRLLDVQLELDPHEEHEKLQEVSHRRLENLKYSQMDLRGAVIDDRSCGAIAKALENNYLLKSLNLNGNQIQDSGARVLGQALAHNQRLESLTLAYNQIRWQGCQDLLAGVAQNQTLRCLDLRYNQIHTTRNTTTSLGLGLMILDRALTSLKLSQNSIGDAAVIEILGALTPELPSEWAQESTLTKDPPILQELQVAGCNLSNAVAPALGLMLRHNYSLVHFDLSSNSSLADRGIETLIAGLKANQTLKSINLSHIDLMSTRSPCELIRILQGHPVLERGHFQRCFGGSDTAQAWAQLVLKSVHFRELDLSECDFEAPGLQKLCEALGNNHSLEHLELSSSGLKSDALIQHLATALKKNTSLRFLNLGYNCITLRGCKWLNEAVQYHSDCQLSNETLILEGNSGMKDKRGVVVTGGILPSELIRSQ